MMHEHSEDWIQGYIYSKMEKHILNALVNKLDSIEEHSILVPKAWFFGLTASRSDSNTLSETERYRYIDELNKLFRCHNSSLRNFTYKIKLKPHLQYMEFTISAVAETPIKEMTVDQIEKELGYKIKIIGS